MHKLRWKTSIYFIVIIISISATTLAKNEDKSEEISDSGELTTSSLQSSEVSQGPPDSHEAMNNRQIHSKTKSMRRKKRSYEFLMGLINNNSKYEVTKVDPSTASSMSNNKRTLLTVERQAEEQLADKKKKKTLVDEKPKGAKNIGLKSTETLLELMVRIAAHPDQWEQVHKLLEKIDEDLVASKLIVDNLDKSKYNWREFEKENKKSNNNLPLDNNKSNGKYSWSSSSSRSINNDNNNSNSSNKSNKSYPKTFSYHRVTGKPIYLNKNPKAYIAVSVIAPKSMHSRNRSQEDEELILENELEQLKPWNQQNLKNINDIRSKWSTKNRKEEKRQRGTSKVF